MRLLFAVIFLAATLALGEAKDYHSPYAFLEPEKCWHQLSYFDPSNNPSNGILTTGNFDGYKTFTCKTPEWKLYFAKRGQMPQTDYTIACRSKDLPSTREYVIAWKTYHLENEFALEPEDRIFCANNLLDMCEEEAKKLYSDKEVSLNYESTGFMCKTEGAKAYFKKYPNSVARETSSFLCIQGSGGKPNKIQAMFPNEIVELGPKSLIFCKNPNATTTNQQPGSDFAPPPQQPISDPISPSHQPNFGHGAVPPPQYPGSNPGLPQLQQCYCQYPVAPAQNPGYPYHQAQYPGYPTHQAQYPGYAPFQLPGYGPLQQYLCHCPVAAAAVPNGPVVDV